MGWWADRRDRKLVKRILEDALATLQEHIESNRPRAVLYNLRVEDWRRGLER